MATQAEVDNIWHTLGRLEEGQRQLESSVADLREELRGGVRDVNGRIDDVNGRIDHVNGRIDQVNERIDQVSGRIDRLFYAIVGIGGAIVVAIVASNYLGG